VPITPQRLTSYLCLATLLTTGAASAQTAQNLAHPAPAGALIGFLLTDGRALFQANNYQSWYTLTPDNTGSYVNGTWKQVASLATKYAPYAFSSDVLADGRVVITGGEYNFNNFKLTDKGAVYDPVANTWTPLKPPKGWGFIGDSPSSVLPDGRLLLGRKLDMRIAALDPVTLKWTELAATGKADFNAEEGWTLLPNGTVLTYDVKNAPNSEIYDPAAQTWTSAGTTVANLASPPESGPIKYGHGLIYVPPGEVGPGMLRPDGTVFATGGTTAGASAGHTAIYTPPASGKGVGTWAAGPDFPTGDDAADSFAALLPNGDVIVEGESGALYQFDGTHLTDTKFNGLGGSLLVLPTGEILVNGSFVLRGASGPNAAWAPVITNYPSAVTPGSTYPITGQQFNGLSQANSFGDELQTATNYPLVRLINQATQHVFYARTHGHSSMGVATGTLPVSTNFDVPTTIETGATTLEVVANGIPSAPVTITVQ
jgi:hypothetical protein